MSGGGRAAEQAGPTRRANGRAPGRGAGPGRRDPGAAPAADEAEPAGVSAAAGRPRWLVPGTLAASLAGLGVSSYLTVAHYTTTALLACPENATVDCEKVTTSPESVIVGVPVAVFGLVYFVAMLALCSAPAWRSAAPAVRLGRMGAAVAGLGFVCYLIYVELFEVDAICLWCTSVHVINLLLFAMIMLGTAATSGAQRDA
ncbi:MAG TPA: vitamin K epoxide reductase family protein [Actinocrinis sp.]